MGRAGANEHSRGSCSLIAERSSQSIQRAGVPIRRGPTGQPRTRPLDSLRQAGSGGWFHHVIEGVVIEGLEGESFPGPATLMA